MSFANVKVTRIENDQIFFQTNSGAEISRPVSSVMQAAVDDEPAFTSAEESLSSKRYEAATDQYLKTLQSTAKPWLKDWCAYRILAVAPQVHRFDASVSAYAQIALSNPTLAMQKKPALPPASSTFLDTAINQIDNALAAPSIKDENRLALLSLELDIARAKSDSTKAGKIIDQLAALKMPGIQGIQSANILAYQKLEAAKDAFYKKDYKGTIATIDSNKSAFSEPAQQADALYLRAEAKQAIAEQSQDATDLKDAAIAYLRVTSHFQDLPSAPHVPDSYLAAASIMEKLNDPAGATALYQELISRYNTQPAAEQARQALSRLKSNPR